MGRGQVLDNIGQLPDFTYILAHELSSNFLKFIKMLIQNSEFLEILKLFAKKWFLMNISKTFHAIYQDYKAVDKPRKFHEDCFNTGKDIHEKPCNIVYWAIIA